MNVLWWLLAPLIIYFLLYVISAFWGCTHVSKWRSLRMGVIGYVLLVFASFGVSQSILSIQGAVPILLILLWILPYSWVRGHSETAEDKDFSKLKGEFLTGSSLAALLFLINNSSVLSTNLVIVVNIALVLYSAAASTIYFTYYRIFNAPFRSSDMLTIMLSDRDETFSFLRDQVGFRRLAEGFLFVIAITVITAYFSFLLSSLQKPETSSNFVIILLSTVLALFLGIHYGKNAFPFRELMDGKKDMNRIKKAREIHKINLEQLKYSRSIEPPGNVVLIIGESANRNHMSAFNPLYPVETTPWETKMKENPGFYFFPESYSCFSQTAEVLSLFLTGMNQYNHRSLKYMVSLIDAARSCGMETWWISNHVSGGSLMDYIAGTADHLLRTAHPRGDDHEILSLLKQVLLTGRHFIVLHIMGSHIRYEDRIPAGFDWVEAPGADKHVRAYDTSIAYTDKVLREIYDYCVNTLSASAIVYVSDHGEDMKYTHGTGHFTYDMVRIPMWIYLSDEYRLKFPDKARNLEQNQSKVFTNDLIFDTICGLLGTTNSSYTDRFDLTNTKYELPSDMAVTMLGKVKLKTDIEKHNSGEKES